MMASHRPSDAPVPVPVSTSARPVPAKVILPKSGFLLGFDWVLALGVLVLAFLVASFAVKNADFWMHLATGRLIAEGGYSFGHDPFSYSGEGRTWVNHAWLFDLLLFLVYQAGEGAGVVIAKAAVVALTAGVLLFASRKPGDSLFPGIACVTLALLAAAPRLTLQPMLASYLFLAVTMFLLIRLPKGKGSWALPIAIGLVFALWSNTDEWFVLGPATLALYAVGQFLKPDEGVDLTTVLKALGVGVVGCMVNPHHVGVWALPVELINAEVADALRSDREFGHRFRSGLDPDVWNFSLNPLNPIAALALAGLFVAAVALNARRTSWGLVLATLAAVAVAMLFSLGLPFAAVAIAPVAAVNLAEAVRHWAARPVTAQTAQFLHALRSTGRVAAGTAGLLAVAATYAGWLHPVHFQRRWAWAIEPSQSFKMSAERIGQWRAEGLLPPDARLLNLQADAAAYVAWYAPGQKTFFDHRLAFHAEEAADFAAIRKYLAKPPQLRRQDPFDLPGFLRANRIAFLITSDGDRFRNERILNTLWSGTGMTEWPLWHVTGRAVIVGWARQDALTATAFERMRFDPLRAAYIEAEPLPPPDIRPVVPRRDNWDKFLAPPPKFPHESEESVILLRYRDTIVNRATGRHLGLMVAANAAPLYAAKDLGDLPALRVWMGPVLDALVPVQVPAEVPAATQLAVRAARKAIVSSPDHPDGYYFLARAYTDSAFLQFPDMQSAVTGASLARCIARLPKDPGQRVATFDVRDACQQLANAHSIAQPFRLDLKLEVTRLSVPYLRDSADNIESNLVLLAPDEIKDYEIQIQQLRKEADDNEKTAALAERELQRAKDKYANLAATISSPLEQAAVARGLGLHHDAIERLYKVHLELQKQLETDERRNYSKSDLAMQLAVHAELVELMMFSGQFEEAVAILDSVDNDIGRSAMQDPDIRGHFTTHRAAYLSKLHGGRVSLGPFDVDPAAAYRAIRQKMALASGDFAQAIQVQSAEAEAIRVRYANFMASTFPAGPPKAAGVSNYNAVYDVFLTTTMAGLNPYPVFLGAHGRTIAIAAVQRFNDLARMQIEAHSRLAFTYLEWGNTKGAKASYQEVLKTTGLPIPPAAQLMAKEYLDAIDKANVPMNKR